MESLEILVHLAPLVPRDTLDLKDMPALLVFLDPEESREIKEKEGLTENLGKKVNEAMKASKETWVRRETEDSQDLWDNPVSLGLKVQKEVKDLQARLVLSDHQETKESWVHLALLVILAAQVTRATKDSKAVTECLGPKVREDEMAPLENEVKLVQGVSEAREVAGEVKVSLAVRVILDSLDLQVQLDHLDKMDLKDHEDLQEIKGLLVCLAKMVSLVSLVNVVPLEKMDHLDQQDNLES